MKQNKAPSYGLPADTVYQKVGNRYKPLGRIWTGFPSNGIWLVKDGSASCIIQLSEIGHVPIFALQFRQHVNALAEHMREHWNSKREVGESLCGMAQAAADFFACLVEEQKKQQREPYKPW